MPILFRAPQRLDAASIKSIRQDFEVLATAVDDVVIDMARTETLDGSGVGAMVFAFKRLSANGKRLSVRNVSGQPLDLLNEAGLLRTLAAERRVNGSAGRLNVVVRGLRMARLLAARTTGTAAAPVISALRSTKPAGTSLQSPIVAKTIAKTVAHLEAPADRAKGAA